MRTIKSLLAFTFEYEAYGDDPGFVELAIHFNFTPGTPETGRFGPPENYDPGSGHEVEYLRAERECVDANGTKHWVAIPSGDFLDEQCQKYLASRDEDDLLSALPERDPDDERDARRDMRLMERGQ
jgi:hypothetical protein